MAGVTGGRETCLGVIRILRALVVLHVAGAAGPAIQLVIPVQVTLRTRQRSVRAGQGETGLRVVESSISPRGCVVAGLAGLREPRLHVVGILGALIVLQMARHASRIFQVVIPIDVALFAWGSRVRTGQREACVGVIETGIGP